MNTIKIPYNNLKLHGNVFSANDADQRPGVLFIHGWQSGQNRFFTLAEELAQKGFICLTFDLAGHQESEGDINNLSVKNYVEACVSAYDYLTAIPRVNTNDITVIGSSFGSYLGVILTSYRPVKNLILRVPSNYPDDQFEENKKLKSSSSPEVMDWRLKKLDSRATKSLKATGEFQGNILLVESEKDELVPHQTVQNYLDAVTNKDKLTYLLMKDAPHSIMGDPELTKQFNQAVLKWLEGLIS